MDVKGSQRERAKKGGQNYFRFIPIQGLTSLITYIERDGENLLILNVFWQMEMNQKNQKDLNPVSRDLACVELKNALYVVSVYDELSNEFCPFMFQ